MSQYICKYCGKEFKSGQSLGAHLINCKKNPNNYQNEFHNKRKENFEKRNPLNEYILKCQVCGKEYKLQLRQNQYENGKYKKTCCSKCAHKLTSLNTNLEEKNNKISLKNKKEYILPKIKYCQYCGCEYISASKSNFCCEEHRKLSKSNKCSNIAKINKLGGYNLNSIKNHHHGNYHGIHCDSSWELAYLVYCLEHNIDIKRCNIIKYYKLNKQIRKYYPDFIVNNQIIEIKGFFDKVAKIKSDQNPDVKVLLYNDLKPMLDYTINKYGNKFWEILYK